MAVTFTVLIPTIGRDHLLTLLWDQLVPQLGPGDEVWVVGDGAQPRARTMVEGIHPQVRYGEFGPTKLWGHPQRNWAMEKAAGTHIYSLDDDDTLLPGALATMRRVVEAEPSRIHVFRARDSGMAEDLIWGKPELRCGNVSTQCFVVPNEKGRLGTWGSRYEGDFDFLTTCVARRREGLDALSWRKEVVALHGRGGAVRTQDRAVVTLCIGHDKLSAVTHPSLRAYAKRIGADFVVIDQRKLPKYNICYEKYQLGELLRQYSRLIYLDTDVVVRRSAPSLFDVVPEGNWGGLEEGGDPFWKEHGGRVPGQYKSVGADVSKLDPKKLLCLNAGVMVMDRTHLGFFENPALTNVEFWDQPWWNWQLVKTGKPVTLLPRSLHCIYPRHRGDIGSAQIAHMANWGINEDAKTELAREVLQVWGEAR